MPNAMFFVSGNDQFFTEWSLSYLQDNFYTDTWLIAGEFGAARILTAPANGNFDSFPTEEQLIGAILVRKPNGAQ